MKRTSSLILAILLPVQYVFVKLIAGYPSLVENYYSRGLYPVLSRIMRFSLGIFPFSVGDFLYAFFILMIIRWIVLRIKTNFRNPGKWIVEILASFSIIYACFHLFWGFNYYRLPLHKSLHIKDSYTTEELVAVTKILIQKSNEIHKKLIDNDTLAVPYHFSKAEMLQKTVKGYSYIVKDFPELAYHGKSLKRSLFSIPLTYMGFNGYLNPLTNEAQVNTLILPYKIPTTASHEIGHQLGFAKENEANFIACLVTMKNPDPYFSYSGYTFALSHCLSELYRRDPEKGDELLKLILPGILKNYAEVSIFWEKHRNPLEPYFQSTYGGFLKANNQIEGMKSYSYVVALLVNYFENVKNES
ncbi:MAG: DUF3810 domain-containing protein [Gillisia sp.]